jgi:RHO1 GDP-GTP exchange protein 1/2
VNPPSKPSRRHESVDSTVSDASTVPRPSVSMPVAPSFSTALTERIPAQVPVVSSQSSLSRTRSPIVYPALLSRVAIALRERLILGDKQKDGLTYPNAFTGSEAVDLIAYIIKTSDRNLALLLGRALDAQRWFHDVTYVHRYPSPLSRR